jgi:hypothetical protein
MLKIFQGLRPDVTPAQLVALFVGGVPVIATLLHVFGVYDLSEEQQDALTKAIQWGGLVAIALFGADAGLRAARGHAAAKVDSAAISVKSEPPVGPTAPAPTATPAPTTVPAAGAMPASGAEPEEPSLPTDEEEFGLGGPDGEDAGWTEEAQFADAGVDEDYGPESRLAPAWPEDEQP